MNDIPLPMAPPQLPQQMPTAPYQIPANAPMEATLEAQEWNAVFAGLNELPMRIARPVWDKLMTQLNRQPALSR